MKAGSIQLLAMARIHLGSRDDSKACWCGCKASPNHGRDANMRETRPMSERWRTLLAAAAAKEGKWTNTQTR